MFTMSSLMETYRIGQLSSSLHKISQVSPRHGSRQIWSGKAERTCAKACTCTTAPRLWLIRRSWPWTLSCSFYSCRGWMFFYCCCTHLGFVVVNPSIAILYKFTQHIWHITKYYLFISVVWPTPQLFSRLSSVPCSVNNQQAAQLIADEKEVGHWKWRII